MDLCGLIQIKKEKKEIYSIYSIVAVTTYTSTKNYMSESIKFSV